MPNPETLGHNELNCESFESASSGGCVPVSRLWPANADVLKRVRVGRAVARCRAACRYGESFGRRTDAKRHCDNVVARYRRESSTLRHAPGASTPTIQHLGTIYAPQVGGSLT